MVLKRQQLTRHKALSAPSEGVAGIASPGCFSLQAPAALKLEAKNSDHKQAFLVKNPNQIV